MGLHIKPHRNEQQAATAAAESATATGGYVSFISPTSPSPFAGKTVHTFTSSGNFVTPTAIPCDLLIVGAGGGGGGDNGGGGAGGEVTQGTSATLAAGTYAVTVGGGGRGQHYNNNAGGLKGGYSQFDGQSHNVFARSGGGGAAAGLSGGSTAGGPVSEPQIFGSGGGSGVNPGNQSTQVGAKGTAQSSTPVFSYPTGYIGGSGSDGPYYNAGGGAGAAGDGMKGGNPPAGPTTFGNGGDGIPNGILGTDYYWGGGGGGGQFTPPANSIQNGGKGGGGGGATGPSPGTPAPGGTGDTNGLNPAGSGPTDGSPGGGNGAQCTGGGGGGDGRVYYSGGNGGSGIVIVAYPT